MTRFPVRFSPLLLVAACANPPSANPVRIDHVEAPTDARDASRIAFDLDGDGRPDNVAGTLMAGMLLAYGQHDSWEARLDTRLTTDVDWEVSDGETDVPLGVLSDLGGGADAGWVAADHVQIEGGRIGGALVGDYRTVLAESYSPYVSERLAAGETDWGALADANHDGRVTVDEVLADPTFQVLTTPDLDLDGDGVRESLSFAFEVTAE